MATHCIEKGHFDGLYIGTLQILRVLELDSERGHMRKEKGLE